MNQSKVYRLDSDIYGETCITVNGKRLGILRYHQPFGACDENLALTILADYFEVELTRDQLDQGKGKCWKLHKDFACEVVSVGGLIWSQDIKLWIELHHHKEITGKDLIKTSGPISLTGILLGNTERKVYHLVRDIDGSIDIFANDDMLDQIRHHQLSDEFCDEDMALTILADYFGEKPTREQISRGESKCWELHLDFANEVVIRCEWIIFDDQIKSWIDQRIGKANLEIELTRMLETLPVPIIITKGESIYKWKLLNKKGTASTFINAIQDALET